MRGKDPAAIAISDQGGQVAAVVNVGVRKDDRVDILDAEGQAAVALVGLFARTLVQPTLQEQGVAVDIQQMLRTCHRLRGAVKSDPHAGLLRSPLTSAV